MKQAKQPSHVVAREDKAESPLPESAGKGPESWPLGGLAGSSALQRARAAKLLNRSLGNARLGKLMTAPVQRQEKLEEEEPLQRQENLEDEELQMQAEPGMRQRRSLEDEEQLQAKMAPLQRHGAEPADGNRTGMPDRLKGGLEQLSGLDLSDVRVHYNSSKPAQVNALAYTQGQDIEVGPGQERHLAHEGWHAVQQMQGRVKPTAQARGVAINADTGLEREADVMGAKALQLQTDEQPQHSSGRTSENSVPLSRAVMPSQPVIQKGGGDPAKKKQYRDALIYLLRLKIKKLVQKSLEDYFSNQVKGDREKLGKYWEKALVAKFKDEAKRCLEECIAGSDQVLARAMEYVDELFQYNSNSYNEEDLAPVDKMKANVVEDLDSYLSLDETKATEIIEAAQKRIAAHLNKALDIMFYMDLRLRPVHETCQRLSKILEDHDVVCEFVRTTLKTDAVCNNIIAKQQAAIQVLKNHTREVIDEKIAKAIGTHGHEDNISATLNLLTFGFEEVCSDAYINYRKLVRRFSQENRDAIMVVCKGGNRLASLQAMLNFYGLVGYDALLLQPPAVMQSCLSTWSVTAICGAIKAKAQPGASLATLSQLLAIAGSGKGALAILQQINQGGVEMIALPEGVTALGWQIVGGCFFPSAFSVGNLETDVVCMKHALEELGENPSKEKQEAYFLDMVQACKAAKGQLAGDKDVDSIETDILLNGCTWHIIVKQVGKVYEVFHIDSGYNKSTWIKK